LKKLSPPGVSTAWRQAGDHVGFVLTGYESARRAQAHEAFSRIHKEGGMPAMRYQRTYSVNHVNEVNESDDLQTGLERHRSEGWSEIEPTTRGCGYGEK